MSVQRRPWRTEPSDPQAEALLEKVVASENLHRAWRQVKRNKGAAGVDGRDIAETEAFLREHWPAIRKQLLEETCNRGIMKGFVRVFVAVDPGDAVCAALAEAIRLLRKTHPRVKWVSPENIHLTLAFLGEVPAERVDEIGSALESVAAVSGAFSCAVKGVGWFGPPRSPRVVWAGMEEAPPLMRLQAEVAAALRELGFTPEDRPFHPHLTLGRVKSSRDAAGLAEALERRRDAAFGRMPVDRVLVMRSELRPQGPAYSVLYDAPMRRELPPAAG